MWGVGCEKSNTCNGSVYGIGRLRHNRGGLGQARLHRAKLQHGSGAVQCTGVLSAWRATHADRNRSKRMYAGQGLAVGQSANKAVTERFRIRWTILIAALIAFPVPAPSEARPERVFLRPQKPY